MSHDKCKAGRSTVVMLTVMMFCRLWSLRYKQGQSARERGPGKVKAISCQSKRCTRVAATAVPAGTPHAPQASCAQGSRLASTIPSKLPPSISRTACTVQTALPGTYSAGRYIPYGFQSLFASEHDVSRDRHTTALVADISPCHAKLQQVCP